MSSPANAVDQFLCHILRGEKPCWRQSCETGFEQAFLKQSMHHGVQALVFDCMRNVDTWQGWPQVIRDQLSAALRAGIAYDLLRAHKTGVFFNELTKRSIDFLIIKGEALARSHYGASSLRTRCDTDLFIKAADIDDVRHALMESGFEVIPPIYKTHQFSGVSGHGTAASVHFDIHWRILNAARYARVIDFQEALEQSVELPGMDKCRTLGAVDSLLLACMHRKGSENHDPDRLIWLFDIHLLVTAMTPAQLSAFVQKALDRGVQSACLEGLRVTQACLKTKIPDEVMEKLAAEVSAETSGGGFSNSNLSLLIDDMKCLPGLHSKWGLVRELFFPASDSLMYKYDKNNRLWLPWLYLRQVLGGTARRLLLK